MRLKCWHHEVNTELRTIPSAISKWFLYSIISTESNVSLQHRQQQKQKEKPGRRELRIRRGIDDLLQQRRRGRRASSLLRGCPGIRGSLQHPERGSRLLERGSDGGRLRGACLRVKGQSHLWLRGSEWQRTLFRKRLSSKFLMENCLSHCNPIK